MSLRTWYRSLDRPRRIALWSAIGITLYAVLGFLVLPAVLQSQTVKYVKTTFDRDLTIERTRFNPFTFELAVEGLVLPDADGSRFAAFDRLYVNIDPAVSIRRGSAGLGGIELDRPFVHIHRRPDATLNYADFILPPDPEVEEEPVSEGEEIFGIYLGKLAIREGTISLLDEEGQHTFELAIAPLNFEFDEFSTRVEHDSPYSFEATIGESAAVAWTGTFDIPPVRSKGTLKLEGLPLRKIWEYMQDDVGFEISQGDLAVEIDYLIDGREDTGFAVSDGRLEVNELAIIEPGGDEAKVAVPSLAVSGITFDLESMKAGIASIESRGGSIKAAREQDGSIDLQKLFAPVEADTSADAEEEAAPEDTQEEPGPEFALTIAATDIKEYLVQFTDRAISPPAKFEITPMTIGVRSFTTDAGGSFDLSSNLGFASGGTLSVGGPINLDPLSATLQIVSETISITPIAPYLGSATALSLAGGAVNTDLALEVGSGGEQIGVTGSAALVDLELRSDSEPDPVLAWKALQIDGLDFEQGETMQIAIAEVDLNAPAVKLRIRENGTTTFDDIAAPAAPESAETPDSDTPDTAAAGDSDQAATEPDDSGASQPDIRIGSLRMNGGSIGVRDESITPHFDIPIEKIQFALGELATGSTKSSSLKLSAELANHGSLNVDGDILPLGEPMRTDLDIKIANVDMRRLSPYVTRGIGYTVEAGKLGLDIGLGLDGTKIDANNSLVLQKLDLGSAKGQTPNVAVPVALTLLSDSSGRIKLDLPVEGDTSAPGFRYLGALRDAFLSVVTKAATSPLALLGSVAGMASDDSGYVAFALGSSQLDPLQGAKLDRIAGVLAEKPKLMLSVVGGVNAAGETEALSREKVLTRIRSVRFAALEKKDKAPSTVDEVTLTREETMDLMGDLYKEELDERPSTLLKRLRSEGTIPEGSDDGAEEKALIAAMHDRLSEVLAAGPADLQSLAQRRADAVRNQLLATGTLTEDRVRLGETTIDAKIADDQVRNPLQMAVDVD